ncbi:GNAT family N-acetyltransferase [Longitalea arenae]|uniref:GNAT family N-acetyltransferase n=1 Tax=Longitalea arenae TaxID=2812558 RepID=UPI0019686E5D|nr:GNAT family N-acetyltransferase [Longitalea arenae]
MSVVTIRTGKEFMDVTMIHQFLSTASYWAKGISYVMVDRSLTHSFCIGAFVDNKQVAFGRVITDYYTFGWFADFFVLPEYRGQGISKKMLAHIMEQPWSKRLRRKMLNTRDAHGLYRQFQFKELGNPSFLLEVYNPDAHLQEINSL